MLLLIEGVDRTGKTSLATRLAARAGGSLYHFSKPHVWCVGEYCGPLSAWQPGLDPPVVLDRGHIGEIVWPIVFERHTDMGVAQRRWIEMFYRSRGAVLIHADRDDVGCWLRELNEHDEPIQDDVALGAKAAFDMAVRSSCLPSFTYHHGDDVEDVLEFAMQASRASARGLSVTPRWVGSPTPKLLIVGRHAGGRWFPYEPRPGSVGEFLMQELTCWRHVALVNAMQPESDRLEPLHELHHVLGEPKVLALGGYASDILEDLGVPHTTIGQAEYFRRVPAGNLGETIKRYL